MADPAEIYQVHLDLVTRLLWDGDFEGVCHHMSFPGRMETNDVATIVTSPEELFPSLKTFRDSMLRQGAQAYHRICLHATRMPDDPNLIVGRHRTYVMRGGTYVVPPFENEMRLLNHSGHWKAAGIRSTAENAHTGIISPNVKWVSPTFGKGKT